MTTPTSFRKPKRFIKDARQRISVKGLILYILPLPAIPAAIGALINGKLFDTLLNAGCYALFLYAALLMRQGLAEETKYLQKRITRPPKNPLKFYSAVITAAATGVIAWLGAGYSLLISIVFTSGAFLGMYLSYGFDPRSEKSAPGNAGYSTEEISQTLEEASAIIADIDKANERINNREFNNRIDRICEIANSILQGLEQDPRDIRRARKFLKVYLEGAKTVTDGYAKTHAKAESSELEQNFRNVLEKIEAVFLQQKEKLMEDNVFDLDVQIEVLTTQLKQEGII